MKTKNIETQENKISKALTNPWWLKLLFHLCIISVLLNMAYDEHYFMEAILFSAWILISQIIEIDMIIVNNRWKIYWMLFILLRLVTAAPDAIRLFHSLQVFYAHINH